MANTPKAINLLPGKEGGFLTQFLTWSLTIGRLLIILVETLALGTFLYRFNLDMQIVDLHDQIKSESAVVGYFGQQEEDYRNLQARLALAKTYGNANPVVTVFEDVANMGRGKVTFKSLFVTLDSVKIEASAPSANALSQFTEALKVHPQISEVSVDKVENKSTTATIILVISAKLKTNPALVVPEVSIVPGAVNPAPAAPAGGAQ